jgi:hypothetical protein
MYTKEKYKRNFSAFNSFRVVFLIYVVSVFFSYGSVYQVGVHDLISFFLIVHKVHELFQLLYHTCTLYTMKRTNSYTKQLHGILNPKNRTDTHYKQETIAC